MLQTPREIELKEACDKLETALLTPVLSGELVEWVANVQESTQGLDETLQRFAKESLHADYREIAKTDMELASRIQQMVEEEQKLLQQKETFFQRLHQLAKRAPQVHSDEAKVADERLKVEQLGLDLITEVKRLQTRASTWLQEAVYRDRGPID